VFVRPFVEWAAPYHAQLQCAITAKTWSAAPVRAAAVLSIHTDNNPTYVNLVYTSLVMAEFSAMPPIVQSLYRSHTSGKVRAAASYDIFCRCLKVFNEKNRDFTKIQINDVSAALESVRDILQAAVPNIPKT
jgi:hypothetical protein